MQRSAAGAARQSYSLYLQVCADAVEDAAGRETVELADRGGVAVPGRAPDVRADGVEAV